MRVSPRRAAARSAPVDKGSLVHKPKSLSASMQKRVGHVLSREDADLIFQPRKTLEVKPVANMLPRGTIVTVFTDGESVSSSDGNFYTKAEGQFEWLGCLEVDHRILLSDDNLNRHCIPKDELQRLGRKWKTKRRFIYKFTSVVKFQEPKFLCSQKPMTEWFSFEPEALLLPQT